MAIYHFSVKTISRSAGRTATAGAAYRSGEKIDCEREGITHDYTRKAGVEYKEIIAPADAPEWAKDRSKLWNAAEAAELRKNSTVAREFEVAFPTELNKEECIELVHDFAQTIVERHGCVVDIAMHEPSREGDERNHHAHILLTTRRITPNGFAEKTRELDEKKSGEVVHWREAWATHCNEKLQKAGVQERVDHRSLEAQGIDRVPTVHLGHAATALERQGVRTEIGIRNDQARLGEHLKNGLNAIVEQSKALEKEIKHGLDKLVTVSKSVLEKFNERYGYEQYRSSYERSGDQYKNHFAVESGEQTQSIGTLRTLSSVELVRATTAVVKVGVAGESDVLLQSPQTQNMGLVQEHRGGRRDHELYGLSPTDRIRGMTDKEVVQAVNELREKARVELYTDMRKENLGQFKQERTRYFEIKEDKPLFIGIRKWEEELNVQKFAVRELQLMGNDLQKAIEHDGMTRLKERGYDYDSYLGNIPEKDLARSQVHKRVEAENPELSERFYQIDANDRVTLSLNKDPVFERAAEAREKEQRSSERQQGSDFER
jgi:ATP-dependent exoDNAse (exonuclease V) alpha subunit